MKEQQVQPYSEKEKPKQDYIPEIIKPYLGQYAKGRNCICNQISKIYESKDLYEKMFRLIDCDFEQMIIIAELYGQEQTPYANGKYYVELRIPSDYPYEPPKVKFITPIWNPYVDKSGNICLDILEDQWTPALALPQILISIISLFSERIPQNKALNVEAAAEMKVSYKKFQQHVKEVEFLNQQKVAPPSREQIGMIKKQFELKKKKIIQSGQFEKGNSQKMLEMTKNETELQLPNKRITVIDLNKHKNLRLLNLDMNKIQHIDINRNVKIQDLSIRRNRLQQIYLNRNINLTKLRLCDNQFKSINLYSNINLVHLQLDSNHLQAIDISDNIKLTVLSIANNRLASINLKYNKNLTKLDLSSNKLTDIDVKLNTKLTQLSLNNNQLTSIDLKANVNLTRLLLQKNLLTEIDLNDNRNLTDLIMDNNQLASINLSNNPWIKYLSLKENRLQNIACWYDQLFKVYGISIQGQCSNSCELLLIYREGQYEEVLAWGQKEIQKYNNTERTENSLRQKCIISLKIEKRQ